MPKLAQLLYPDVKTVIYASHPLYQSITYKVGPISDCLDTSTSCVSMLVRPICLNRSIGSNKVMSQMSYTKNKFSERVI